jgi:hypothetical protein
MAKKPKDDEAPALYEIDILAEEMKTGAPHWLSPVHTHPPPEKKQEIRDKHRRRHRAAQARAKAEKTLALTKPK